MNFFSLFFIAVGLSMDAFAVAICKGLSMQRNDFKKCLLVGVWFGSFQALMPFMGYLIGFNFQEKIKFLDHWIAFILLFLIGFKMIKEALSGDDSCPTSSFHFKDMFVLSVATSIDAFAAGISLALLPGVPLAPTIILIGVTTFILSMAGVKAGNLFGTRFKSKAELTGGVILVLMGGKILLDHLLGMA